MTINQKNIILCILELYSLPKYASFTRELSRRQVNEVLSGSGIENMRIIPQKRTKNPYLIEIIIKL